MATLVGFYQETWDQNGTALGWQPVAWGTVHADGTAVTIPADGPPAVTLWLRLADAAHSLDAQVAELEPRRRLDV